MTMRTLAARAAWPALALAAVMLHLWITPAEQPINDWQRMQFAERPEVYEAASRYYDVRNSLREAQGELERAESVERARMLPAGTAGLAVTVDPSVTALAGASFRKAALADLKAVTGGGSAYPIHLVVTVDSLNRVAVVSRNIVVPAKVGDPCVVMVRLARGWSSHSRVHGNDILGTCGFYARYGAPGGGMSAWLEKTRLSLALHPPGGPARFPGPAEMVNARSALAAYSPEAVACRAGVESACASLFEGRRTFARITRDPEPLRVAAVPPLFVTRRRSLDGGLLAGIAESVGDERFTAIWRSEKAPAIAFEEETGRPITDWIRERTEESIAPYRPGPSLPFAALAVALFFATTAGLLGVLGSKRTLS